MALPRASLALPRSLAALSRSKIAASATVRTAQFSTSRVSRQDYGQGPTYSGQNPSESKEHPGPEAPDVGQKPASKGGSASPKIHNEPHPGEGDKSAQEHNAEMERKKGGPNERDEETVGKGFWKPT